MDWKKVVFSVNDVSNRRHIAIQDAFEKIFMTANAPSDAAMFANGLDKGNEYVVYFSPGAIKIASTLIAKYRGVLCSPPDKSVALLVGDSNAIETLL